MQQKLKNRIMHASLASQFMLASFVILLAGMLIIGWWISRQIERGVINQTAGVTALYVDSFISPHLQDLGRGSTLGTEHLATLDELMRTTQLGKRIVAFKVWSSGGEILFSTTPTLIGKRFAFGPGLERALSGQVAAHVSDLQEPENVEERTRWARLLEIYAPVRLGGTDQVIAVSEIYQTPDELFQEIAAAQWASWFVVGGCTVAMYLLLAGMVGRGSNLIARQRAELVRQVRENAQLHERVRNASARTVAINERFLRRIGADLHDGPGQDIGFALLRLDALEDHCEQCPVLESREPVRQDLDALKMAMQSALRELRAIAAGLRLPELDALSPRQTVARAVEEHMHKTKSEVKVLADSAPAHAPLSVKITLYRIVQEALANGQRHAPGAAQEVTVWNEDDHLCLEVSDNGVGFDPQALRADNGRLGLAGMRERVQALGGTFSVESALGHGTHVRVRLPKDVTSE